MALCKSIAKVILIRNQAMNFSSTVHDNICSLATGVVSTPGYNEIVMNTFSGRVLAFTTEQLQEKAEGDKYGRSKGALAKEATISGLNADLKSLHKQIDKEESRFAKELRKKVVVVKDLPP